MRRVIMWNIVTMDGFFEGPSPWDLDFHNDVWGEELEHFGLEQCAAADTILFGRATYEGMASHWPTAKGKTADFMNAIRKVVFSRTLESADWNNTRLVAGPAEEEVARLKQEPGKDILTFGSADLCSTLMRHGLIDEYRIGVAPVVLGGGSPLFKPGPDRFKFELVDTRALKTGCVILTYRPRATT